MNSCWFRHLKSSHLIGRQSNGLYDSLEHAMLPRNSDSFWDRRFESPATYCSTDPNNCEACLAERYYLLKVGTSTLIPGVKHIEVH